MSLLRSIFGPSRDEIWGQFAAAVSGTFEKGGFWTGSKVEVSHGQWIVTFDTYTVSTGKSTVTYTRIRAPYVNPDGFQFSIHRRNIFSGLGKLLGMQDVTVGFPQFDENFIIKGNDEAKLRQLFADPALRDLISTQPNIQFRVIDDDGGHWGKRNFPPDVNELYFQITGAIRDIERLKALYVLFAETLDQLCKVGSAYEKSPGVKL